MKKVAVVTGAGSGIGKSVAIALSQAGFQLVLAGRRLESLQQTASTLDSQNGNACVVTDVTDPESVEQLFASVQREFGRVDLLFNNAGIDVPAVSLEELSWKDWKAVVDTNLTGVFLCTQGAFRLMKDQDPQGGRIINNGSIAATVPRPHSIAYAATKHAVTGITKATSLDGRKYQIACGQIDIGNAQTDLTVRMGKGVLQADGSTKTEPTFDVQHVAEAVTFMANLPLDTNVQFMTVMATNMPFIGRG
jgi:NADP-dependent 3-hydroxy acid dehydrogenase YdfG